MDPLEARNGVETADVPEEHQGTLGSQGLVPVFGRVLPGRRRRPIAQHGRVVLLPVPLRRRLPPAGAKPLLHHPSHGLQFRRDP